MTKEAGRVQGGGSLKAPASFEAVKRCQMKGARIEI
eukprot:CAMPEP_0171942142 /NCGR_PEP_ID=MMETSP0993-20121228/38425_1 /TAXON_ID=483369 /ORGANISM="non described non described, Strain CCMP2098" /LENGTH=35 /DNA_ID= /DNA_START= /DNA_END= /DNA_ORIENTATION=